MTDEAKIRRRALTDFEWFAPKCLRIAIKEASTDALRPLELNEAQRHTHNELEAQLRTLGKVRALVLKGRQQGISTYTEGRFYWRVIHRRGVKAYILTHKAEATANLFDMVQRYHDHCPPMFKPHVGRSNVKELEFDRLDSRYTVATAGAEGAGRGGTVHFFHGSEVAFWQNADEHMRGALQAVPDLAGTEIILESTANGTGNEFHRLWTEAEKGNGDFIAIFVPWFWQHEYRSEPGEDFDLSDDRGDVPEGELTEREYATAYRLKPAQMAWRRKKIVELGYWGFKQEYPATAAEAFQTSGERSLIPVNLLVKARKANVDAVGQLVIGMDPAGPGKDATAIIRRKGRKAFKPGLYRKLTVPQLAGLAVRIIKNERPHRFYIDKGGLGQGVCDLLLESTAIPHGVVVPVNFGGETIYPDRFRNKKAEMYWAAREWFEDVMGVDVPDGEFGDMLQGQAVQTRFSYDGAQRLVIESKDQLRKRGFPSPDLWDAFCLTFAFPVASDEKFPGVHVDAMAGWPTDHGFNEVGADWSVWD